MITNNSEQRKCYSSINNAIMANVEEAKQIKRKGQRLNIDHIGLNIDHIGVH